MIRRFALTASFLLAGAVPAFAQTHPPSHAQAHPHGPGHMRPDSAHHTAMHARLHGTWKGTLSSTQGGSSGLYLSVALDSLRKLTFRMSTDQPDLLGGASNFVIAGDKLQWTQDLSGTSCQATAVLSAATPQVPETMEGTIACDNRESTFTMRKTG